MNIKRIAVAGLAVSVSLGTGIMTHAFSTSPGAVVQPEASLVDSVESLLTNISSGDVTTRVAVERIDEFVAKIEDLLDSGIDDEQSLLKLKGELLDARLALVHPDEVDDNGTTLVDVTLSEAALTENLPVPVADPNTAMPGEISYDPSAPGGFSGAPNTAGNFSSGGGGGGGGGGGDGGGGLGALIATGAVIGAVAGDNDRSGLVRGGPEASSNNP